MDLTATDLAVREAAFREILTTGRPWDPTSMMGRGVDTASVNAAVNHLVESGRARTDERGRITAAAGLSTAPTPHHVLVGLDPRWTNCAYDALGILGALGADGVIATRSPSTGAAIPCCSRKDDRSGPTPCCSLRTSRAVADRTMTGART